MKRKLLTPNGTKRRPWSVRFLLEETIMEKLIDPSLWDMGRLEKRCKFKIHGILERSKEVVHRLSLFHEGVG